MQHNYVNKCKYISKQLQKKLTSWKQTPNKAELTNLINLSF